MLSLTKKTDYALIALSYLARRMGGVTSAREIASVSGISQPMLTNILKSLAAAGLVTSSRGSSGGYSLTKAVGEINLHEVISIIEGPFQLIRCMHDDVSNAGQGQCELTTTCPIRQPAQRVHHRLRNFLETVTLGELFVNDSSPINIPAIRRTSAAAT